MARHPQRTLYPLPRALIEIRDIIGFEGMFCLASARGGERIYIPGKLTPDHWLAQVVGLEAAEKLVAHFVTNHPTGKRTLRGAPFDLPLLPREFRILQLTKQGVSISGVARALGITSRTVSRYRQLHQEAETPDV